MFDSEGILGLLHPFEPLLPFSPLPPKLIVFVFALLFPWGMVAAFGCLSQECKLVSDFPVVSAFLLPVLRIRCFAVLTLHDLTPFLCLGFLPFICLGLLLVRRFC